MSDGSVKCTDCRIIACCTNNKMNGPNNCPMKIKNDRLDQAAALYQNDPKTQKMIVASVNTEGKGAKRWTRVEDTIDFARQMGYEKLGIATCHGLLYEASILTKILENNNFEVVSIGCKCGGISKESLGVVDEEQRNAMPDRGLGNPACNPVGQALILNEEGTDLNIIVGLCVGHDTLFTKYSKAPVTTFVTKDRRLFHNPTGALYGTTMYFRYLLSPVVLR